jgi:L-threonylcarbamoyladenylate synthase
MSAHGGQAPPALEAADARRLQECLAAGGVAILPTDTVYGVACDPLQPRAVRRLYELKGRPSERPAAVMFFTVAHALDALPELGPRERAAMQALLPGSLTLLLPNREGRYPLACAPGVAGSRADTSQAGESAAGPAASSSTNAPAGGSPGERFVLGLRVPLLFERLAVLRAVQGPVMQSSANISGEPEARRLADIPPSLLEGADLVLDGGELPGVASTVLDLREYERHGEWRIVREGPVGRAELALTLE